MGSLKRSLLTKEQAKRLVKVKRFGGGWAA